MNFMLLAVGWLLLAMAKLTQKVVNDEEQADQLSFWLAVAAFVIFVCSIVISINQ
jgi:TRAP-type C4-dicarboxylate transport system permease small subunit